MRVVSKFTFFLKYLWPLLKAPHSEEDKTSIFFHTFEHLSGPGVSREKFIEELAREKRVLHFGFLDAPFSDEKIDKGQLLHMRLQQGAGFLYGVDIDQEALQIYRQRSGDEQNAIYDIQTQNEIPGFLSNEYDLILFSEVLEHLPHPFLALQNLHRLSIANGGAMLCVTVPNAFSFTGFSAAMQGNEVVHPDHYFYFSPFTLRKILLDSGFSNVSLHLYDSESHLDRPGLTKHGVIGVCTP